MLDELIPIVAIISTMIGLPAIIAGAILGSKLVKYKNDELALRREELDLERQRVQLLSLEAENRLLDRKIDQA